MRMVLRPALLALCLASVPARSEVRSPLEWDVREANHASMGPILLAVPKSPIATPVGDKAVYSQVYVSCEKARGRIAIDLANATAPADPGGLQPKRMPRLVCNSRPLADEKASGPTELAASWEISPIGDALARGFPPSALRRCASILILQEVVLPKGWSRETQAIEIELIPYGKALDPLISACGETTATASAAPAPSAPAVPAPATSARAKTVDPAWRPARTISAGRTNVRAGPSLDSAVVAQLNRGERVLVQQAGGEWWKVKPRAGTRFQGYIRQDRLVFRP